MHRQAQTTKVQLHIWKSRDSGFDASHRPGMTAENHTLPFSASLISSSTFGSSMVAGIVQGSPSAIFLMVPRRILPERVFGSRATVIASLNAATGPSFSRTSATISFSISAGGGGGAGGGARQAQGR